MQGRKSHFNIIPKALEGLFEDAFQNGMQRIFSDELWNEGGTVPVNLAETDSAYEMHVMAPTLKKEDFKINVDRGILHVSYDHPEEDVEESRRWIRKEYKVKTFRRSFTLNDRIDVQNITAKYDSGVLVIILPKKQWSAAAATSINVE